jgi:metallo-beta-lactamase class B
MSVNPESIHASTKGTRFTKTKLSLPATAIALAALLLGMASPAVAQPDMAEMANNPPLFLETARKASKWDEPADPAKIVGPIYFVGTRGLSVFLITTSEGLIVLNTGMPGSGPMIEASIRKLGFKPEDIRILLTGHAHVDHVGGHAYLKKISGAKIAMIREEKDLFESGGKLDFHYGKYKEFEFEPAKVDWVFHHGDIIKLGDVAITALLSSGHTKGSTTFVMNVVENGKVYTVVFPNGTSVNPGYRLTKDPSYPGIGDDYRRTFHVLEMLKPDIWLDPHNESYGFDAKLARSAKEGVKAWLDPEGYRKWVVSKREKFEATIDKEMGVPAKTK